MAITRTETQVTWPTASNTATVAAGGNATSEDVALDASCVAAAITLKAEYTAGAPAADDIITFWWLASAGDPDGASTEEYDTPPQSASTSGGAWRLATLALNLGETSGSGKKMLQTVQLPAAPRRGKLFAEGLTAGSTNTITVSATIEEQRAA